MEKNIELLKQVLKEFKAALTIAINEKDFNKYIYYDGLIRQTEILIDECNKEVAR